MAEFEDDPDFEILNSMEKRVYTDETEYDTANRLFRENLPNAARSIITLAMRGTTERVRFDASKYIVERIMGRQPDGGDSGLEQGPLADLLDTVLREEEKSGG
jgi:hypothetical protein